MGVFSPLHLPLCLLGRVPHLQCWPRAVAHRGAEHRPGAPWWGTRGKWGRVLDPHEKRPRSNSPPGWVGCVGSTAKSAHAPLLLCLAEFKGCSPGVCAARGTFVKAGMPRSVCPWWCFIAWGVLFSLHLKMQRLGVGVGSAPYGGKGGRGHREHLSGLLTIFALPFLLQTTRSSTSRQAVKVRPRRVSACTHSAPCYS